MPEPTVVFAGGGTGGHVYPALAVAEALAGLNGGCRPQYLGTSEGIEARAVPQAGLPFTAVSAKGVRGKSWTARGAAAFALGRGVWQAWRALGRWRPDVVVVTSGYVSVPAGLAAWLRRVPLVVLEQNVERGWATRLLSPLARRTVLSFEAGGAGPRAVVLGNPLRASALLGARGTARARWGIPAEAMVVAVMGGSLGARTLNDQWQDALPEVRRRHPSAWILWLTGPSEEARRRDTVGGDGRVIVEGFETRMGDVYAAADVIVSRAGAGTLAELTAWGVPAVLVPLAAAGGGHQSANARWLAGKGAALLADSSRELSEAVGGLLADPARRGAMAEASRALGRPRAAEDVARLIHDMIHA